MRPGFKTPIVYLITSGEATNSNFTSSRDSILAIVRFAVQQNISLIQIREKGLYARSLFELTVAATGITRGTNTRLLLNDRADIALAAEADGVHLTANSIPAAVIRKYFPSDFVIGVSTHSFAAADAVKHEADFVVFGPIFETQGKGEPKGLKELAQVCNGVGPFPVIGLGGIDPTNCESVIDAGASGIAAIRSLNDPDSLRLITRKLEK